MSISTRTGDEGTTALMYGRRVSKTYYAVETYGTVDELNSALGMARATSPDGWVQNHILGVQRNLVALMGQLAVAEEDTERYAASKYPKLTPEMLAVLDNLVEEMESQKITFEGWATPGDTVAAAALDVARTVCRRAERLVIAGCPGGGKDGSKILPSNNIRLIIQYLNRLSDVLWLLARFTETRYPAKAASES